MILLPVYKIVESRPPCFKLSGKYFQSQSKTPEVFIDSVAAFCFRFIVITLITNQLPDCNLISLWFVRMVNRVNQSTHQQPKPAFLPERRRGGTKLLDGNRGRGA
jgi:hypothetical protein